MKAALALSLAIFVTTVGAGFQGSAQSNVPQQTPSAAPHDESDVIDGHWFVYQSDGLFVQPFPGPGRRQQVTTVGFDPEWRKDGKEIIYEGQEGGVMAVAVDTAGGRLHFGTPRNLFSGLREPAGTNASTRPLAVSRDGSRFYWPQPVEQPDSNLILIKTGWAK